MMVFVIVALIFLAYLFVRFYLIKYEKPVYEYRGEYQYSYHGKKNEYFTETVIYPTAQNDNSVVFLFLSGNPGYIRFYDRFLYHLSDIYNKKYTVIGIGQAGQLKSDATFEKYFNLDQQIDHKVQYFQDLINLEKYKNSKFVFLGHSFGCYTALKLMNKIDQNRVLYSILIHPAIERLIDTKNGFIYHLMKLDFIFKIILRLLVWLTPLSFIRWACLVAFENFKYKEGEDVSDQAETLTQWIGIETVQSFNHLARYQFEEILHLNDKDIKRQENKMTVYYAKSDRWTPENMKREFKERFENHVDYQEDQYGLNHTFVIGGSRAKAQIIQQILQLKL